MKHSPQVGVVHQRLDSYLGQGREESFVSTVRRRIEDPLRPRGKDGHFRPSPIVLLAVVLIALSVLTFVCFTAMRP